MLFDQQIVVMFPKVLIKFMSVNAGSSSSMCERQAEVKVIRWTFVQAVTIIILKKLITCCGLKVHPKSLIVG